MTVASATSTSPRTPVAAATTRHRGGADDDRRMPTRGGDGDDRRAGDDPRRGQVRRRPSLGCRRRRHPQPVACAHRRFNHEPLHVRRAALVPHPDPRPGPVRRPRPPADRRWLLALLLLNLGNRASTGLSGLFLGVFAAPGLLAVGAPFSSSSWYPLGIAISVVLWLVVGFVVVRAG